MPPIVMRSRVQVESMAKERAEDGYVDEDGDGAVTPVSSDAIGEMDLRVASDLCVVFLLRVSFQAVVMSIIYRPLYESCSV
jgi:hypothetical protein